MILRQARQKYHYFYGVDSLRLLLPELLDKFLAFGFPPFLHARELQQAAYLLDQRLQHLTETHCAVMELYIDELFKASFLHLQRCHLESISSEITKIFTRAKNWSLHYDQSIADDLLEAEVIIEGILLNTKELIKAQAGEFVLVMPPLTKRQLSICKRIYKYPEELSVLHSFMNRSIIIDYRTSLVRDKMLLFNTRY
jgi:hypothetical protein